MTYEESSKTTYYEKLTGAVKQIAWGYVLLHVDLNLGTINVLPAWLGYVLILSALPVLAMEEESAALLRPLNILLALWEGILWLTAILGISFNSYVPEVLEAALSLYFHFQLLTNLADMAEKYGCFEQKSLLLLRTVRTILITILTFPVPWQKYTILAIAVIGTNIVIAICICSVLFSLAKSLKTEVIA